MCTRAPDTFTAYNQPVLFLRLSDFYCVPPKRIRHSARLLQATTVMLSPRRDFIAVCSKPHQTADVSAVCIEGTRHLATIVGPKAWCLERSLGVKRGKQGMEWETGEGEQRKGGASSAWPLPLSSAACGMCDCRSRSPLKSQIILWPLECVTVTV